MKIDFHTKNRLKLSGTYLVIIMFLTIMFSVIIFNTSSEQIRRGLRPAPVVPEKSQGKDGEDQVQITRYGFIEFEQFRGDRIDESNSVLKRRLIFMNFCALLLGAIISYLLAKRALDPIERAMEKQDRFASDASHELRTPLAAMQSEIEVTLRDKNLSESDARETLESNLDEVKKMTAISSALLSLAHSENQKQAFTQCDLNELIDEVLGDFKSSSPSVKFEFIKSDQDHEITGDPEQIKRLFSILLDNAVKYCENDCKIQIKVTSHSKSLQIDIVDNGIGIDLNDQKLVFDRFYRSDTSRSKGEKSGYGLGLSIAKNIVELHNGQISAHTNMPSGTIIKIIFPKA